MHARHFGPGRLHEACDLDSVAVLSRGRRGERLRISLVDPLDLDVFTMRSFSRTGAYTAGFFAFWLFGAACSAFTCFLQRSSVDINRLCPLEPAERPVGCPKRECPGA